MTWNHADPDQVVELAEAMMDVQWPVPKEDVPALAEQLGWRQVRADVPAYYTGLPISPDLGTSQAAEGELTRLTAHLVDREPAQSEEFSQWLLEVSGSYVVALKERFGPSRVNTFPSDHLASMWDCESGAVLSLVTTPTTIQLKVESPRIVDARRVIAQNPDL
ncbi:MAG TPA: hypothetical protein GX743_08040 [Actinomycetales bacterium]|nr:hypothetical protein [Actinomycetales bacterium]